MREKIEQCPPLEELSPVTREWETAYSDFLDLPYHWQESAPWAKVESTLSEVADIDTRNGLPGGRNVVVCEESMDSVCIEDKFVKLTLTTEAIGSLPEYGQDEYKDTDYELHRS